MKYFSMFSGVGGFELAIQKAIPNAECIGYSEIDKYAIRTYEEHYRGHKNYGDITKIRPEELPDFDMLCGGFPCQAFSIAGKRRGFEDTRGTLFFDIMRIAKVKRPKIMLLENVKGLLNHNKGETMQVLISSLDELGYDVQWMVLNGKFFGVPQNRERVFFICSIRGSSRPEVLPFTESNREVNGTHPTENISDGESERTNAIDEDYAICVTGQQREASRTTNHIKMMQLNNGESQGNRVYHPNGISQTLAGQAGGKGAKTGLYQVENMKIRRLTPVECERLMSWPDRHTIGSDTQRYKQCGNGVISNCVEAIMIKLKPYLEKQD